MKDTIGGCLLASFPVAIIGVFVFALLGNVTGMIVCLVVAIAALVVMRLGQP